MWRWASTTNHRRLCWLHCHNLDIWVLLFQVLSRSRDCTTSSYTSYKDVNLSICRIPNLWTGCLVMNGWVGWVFKLLQNVRVWNGISNLFRFTNSPIHPLGRICQHNFCSKGSEQYSPLHRHTRRHGQDQLVPLGSCNKGQCNACIPRGWLHQRRLPWRDETLFFRVLNHGIPDTILDRVAWTHGLHFGSNCGHIPFGDSVQVHHGGVSDQIRYL
mmetsp:Transcript_6500/g.12886  ORF Transcript_6500/g.12886 Transcript_6500/m.12886 type:complete len:215 (-) Transcript_6500:1255-1899(-)